MPLKHNVGGVWRDVVPWVNVAGVWRKASAWINVGGTWKKVTSLIAATLPSTMSAGSVATLPSSANAQITINNIGGWSLSGNTGTSPAPTGTWWDGVNPASAYEVRWTTVGGAPTTGPTAGVWHSLSVTRIWTSQGTNLANGVVEIREASTGTVLASATVTLNAFTGTGEPLP